MLKCFMIVNHFVNRTYPFKRLLVKLDMIIINIKIQNCLLDI